MRSEIGGVRKERQPGAAKVYHIFQFGDLIKKEENGNHKRGRREVIGRGDAKGLILRHPRFVKQKPIKRNPANVRRRGMGTSIRLGVNELRSKIIPLRPSMMPPSAGEWSLEKGTLGAGGKLLWLRKVD